MTSPWCWVDEQTTALKRVTRYKPQAVFLEQAGGTTKTPELAKALDALTASAALVVWRFNRLGRSLPHLLHIVEQIERAGAHLVSLTKQIDTGSNAERIGGRPKSLTPELVGRTITLIEAGESRTQIARSFNVGASNLRASIASEKYLK